MSSTAPEVWVAGVPSIYGGAGAELDHLVTLLQRRGVRVHIVVLPPAGTRSLVDLAQRGFELYPYRRGIFRDRVVLSFCNAAFLAQLPYIHFHGRPRAVVWFNCMTTPFPLELLCHKAGYIDYHGYVSEYQRARLEPRLASLRPVRILDYVPYLDPDRYVFQPRDDPASFRVGRVSRDDYRKYPSDLWQVMGDVRVPAGVRKEILILGYGANAARKTGPAPSTLDVTTWAPAAIRPRQLYRQVDVLVHDPAEAGESYGRVIVEAYAHGVVPITLDRFAFPELIHHGETGFVARDSAELSQYATELAFAPRRRIAMAEAGYEHLRHRLSNEEATLAGLWPLIAAQ